LSGTEVSGVIGFYGNTDRLDLEPTSPQGYLKAAPPFLIVHGAQDTLVLSEDARKFADRLRAVSRKPVAYAELPGTQHNFDFFHSLRVHAVTDAVVRFAELAVTPTQSTAQSGSTERPVSGFPHRAWFHDLEQSPAYRPAPAPSTSRGQT
jgi:acetyl esterase/lipase